MRSVKIQIEKNEVIEAIIIDDKLFIDAGKLLTLKGFDDTIKEVILVSEYDVSESVEASKLQNLINTCQAEYNAEFIALDNKVKQCTELKKQLNKITDLNKKGLAKSSISTIETSIKDLKKSCAEKQVRLEQLNESHKTLNKLPDIIDGKLLSVLI